MNAWPLNSNASPARRQARAAVLAVLPRVGAAACAAEGYMKGSAETARVLAGAMANRGECCDARYLSNFRS